MQKKIVGSILAFYSCLSLAHTEPKYSVYESKIKRVYPNGKVHHFDASKYAIVKRSNMGQAYKPRCPKCEAKEVIKWRDIPVEVNKYCNTLYLLGGFGPNGTRPLEVTPKEVIVGSNFLPTFTLGYSREVHSRVNLHIQFTTNYHIAGGVGLKF